MNATFRNMILLKKKARDQTRLVYISEFQKRVNSAIISISATELKSEDPNQNSCMDLSQQELPITAYFTPGNKDNKRNPTKKRKLAATADTRRGDKRAVVAPNVRTSVHDSAKRPKKSGEQTTLPILKPPIATTSSRRESMLLADDIVTVAERSIAGSSRSPKANPNTVSHRISVPASSKGKSLAYLASAAAQSLATPPPTNPSKKQPAAVTAIASGIAALPTPETTVRKLGNVHAPSGLRTFDGVTSPCRTKRIANIHVPSSPPLASTPLMMKFPVSMDDDSDTHSRKHSGLSNGARQAIDPDDPFTCGSRDKEVHVVTPVASPVLPSKVLQSAPASSNIIEDLVPSSQSQYLLPVDATPSRKRISKPVRTSYSKPVPSSQSQESEMGMPPSPRNELNELRLPRSVKHTHVLLRYLRTPVHHYNRSSRRRLHQFTLEPSPATSPISSPEGFLHPFLATKSPRSRASSIASPSRSPLKHTPRRIAGNISPMKPMGHTESVKNVRPEQEDDSVTEPESDAEVLKPVQDDGSETEPESEVPVPVRLPTEVGKWRSQGMAQWPPATSPRASLLHSRASAKRSPYRKRQMIASSCTSSLDDLMREGAGMSVPSSRRGFMLLSSATPAVARDFLDMFQGDGSYPDDFPESLRC